MLNPLKKTVLLISVLIIFVALPSSAQEAVEDVIDIFESNNKILAVLEDGQTLSFDLSPGETVIWSGSKGYLGAVLTHDRFSVISVSSKSWKHVSLSSEESEQATASISSHIALLALDDRALGYDALSNRFIETRFPLRDERLAVETADHVGVVITSSRALGFAQGASSFFEVRFSIKESMDNLKLTSHKISLSTSDRLLSFTSSRPVWNEHRL